MRLLRLPGVGLNKSLRSGLAKAGGSISFKLISMAHRKAIQLTQEKIQGRAWPGLPGAHRASQSSQTKTGPGMRSRGWRDWWFVSEGRRPLRG